MNPRRAQPPPPPSQLITHADGSRRDTVLTTVSIFHTISQKPMHLGPQNLKHKCSTTSPGTMYFGVNVHSHESQKLPVWVFAVLASVI